VSTKLPTVAVQDPHSGSDYVAILSVPYKRRGSCVAPLAGAGGRAQAARAQTIAHGGGRALKLLVRFYRTTEGPTF